MRAVITVAGKDPGGHHRRSHPGPGPSERQRAGHHPDHPPPDLFTMVMLVDASQCKVPFGDLADQLAALGNQSGLAIQAQREDTFQAMHRI